MLHLHTAHASPELEMPAYVRHAVSGVQESQHLAPRFYRRICKAERAEASLAASLNPNQDPSRDPDATPDLPAQPPSVELLDMRDPSAEVKAFPGVCGETPPATFQFIPATGAQDAVPPAK